MAFGALAAYAFNGPLGLGMIPSTLLGMLATAVLSLVLDVVLWRPLRARRAGFMSLFLASIGLALVLRQVLLLAYGPQPQTYKVDQYKVYVIGSVRLSEPQLITIIGATAAICALGVFLARSTLGRTMRALADDRALAAIAGIPVGRVITYTWIISGLLAGSRRIRRARAVVVRPELRLPTAAAGLRSRRARRDRQRLRRTRRRARPRSGDGAFDVVVDLGRSQPGLQACGRVRDPDRGADAPPQGLFGRARVV